MCVDLQEVLKDLIVPEVLGDLGMLKALRTPGVKVVEVEELNNALEDGS